MAKFILYQLIISTDQLIKSHGTLGKLQLNLYYPISH